MSHHQSPWRLAAALLLTCGGLASAHEPQLPSDPCRAARAGNAHCIAPWARCSTSERDIGYYVGGGASYRCGEGRYAHEGVWGVDSRPVAPGFRRGTALRWWHGSRIQGGAGQYEPDHKNKPFENARDTVHHAGQESH